MVCLNQEEFRACVFVSTNAKLWKLWKVETRNTRNKINITEYPISSSLLKTKGPVRKHRDHQTLSNTSNLNYFINYSKCMGFLFFFDLIGMYCKFMAPFTKDVYKEL